MKKRQRVPSIVGALLLLSLGATTVPRLFQRTREAWTLLPMSYESRREHQMGRWYKSIQSLRRTLPKNEPLALVLGIRDTEAAIFANYYLYPIRTRLFAGRNDYRNTANDAIHPKTIATVTSDAVELTAYDVLRDRDLRAGRRVVETPQLSEPATSFVLPIATSVDGPAPETFVIEATLLNSGSAEAEVLVTLAPAGRFAMMKIGPGLTRTYYDFVHEVFGTLRSGWMRVESTQPLRAAFYFANRGRDDATRLPNVTGSATVLPSGPLYRDNKLFLLNPRNAPAQAIVGTETIALNPHALLWFPIKTVPIVSGNVYAFVTTRELNGKTDFLWPAK